MRKVKRGSIAAFLIFLSLTPVSGQDNQIVNFLIVKYGDESATQQMASEFLDSFSGYLKQKVPYFKEKIVRGWIANNPVSAKALLRKYKPMFALVSPGFYLQCLYGKNATPILQIPRFGQTTERYYLVASKKGPSSLKEIKNKTVATVFSTDLEFLKRVVFPEEFQPGNYFKLKPSENIGDELFLLLEEARRGFNAGQASTASALLLDEELKKFFQEDEFVWPKLKVIWTSVSLPRDLVTIIGAAWTVKRKRQLKQAFINMKEDPAGTEILELMQSSGFVEIDSTLLKKTLKKYFGADASAIDVKSLADQAEAKFAISPREASNVLEAYEFMKQAARQSSKNDPNHYGYLVRAARFAIWLSYHLDAKNKKSKFANEGISLSQKAIDFDKSRVEGFYYRAISLGLFAQQNKLLAKNSMTQIRRDLTIAIDINPTFDYGGPYRVLGALYLRAPGPPAGVGSKRKAIFHLEEAYKISEDYPENLLFLAESYIKKDKPTKANQLLKNLHSSISKYGDLTDQKDWRQRAAELEQKLQQSN